MVHASGAQLKELSGFVSSGALKPVIDSVYSFDQLLLALEKLEVKTQSSQFCLGNSSVSSTSALLSSSWTITATVLSSNSSAILTPAVASSGSARPDSVIPSSNSVGVTNCSAYDQTSGVSVEGSGSAVFRACARSLPLAPFYTDVHSSPVLCSSSLVVAVVRATSSFLLRCFSVAPSVIASIPA
ncbi:hypothetical protein PC116_g24821 [Phytophthora cactorum]|nr:hypothetical protein PC116_g24821 [Phytophthora cactorum]